MMLSSQAKHSRPLAGKIPNSHLLFTGIIMPGILMSCNLDCEDVVSSKLNGRLDLPYIAIWSLNRPHCCSHGPPGWWRYSSPLATGSPSPVCSPHMSWLHFSWLNQLRGQKFSRALRMLRAPRKPRTPWGVLWGGILSSSTSGHFHSPCQVINWPQVDCLHSNIWALRLIEKKENCKSIFEKWFGVNYDDK